MSTITQKQLIYIRTNHIEDTLHSIGLNASDLTKEQAIKIIANHKSSLKQITKKSSTSSTDFNKLIGKSPDFDTYPGCGYDRSWCG